MKFAAAVNPACHTDRILKNHPRSLPPPTRENPLDPRLLIAISEVLPQLGLTAFAGGERLMHVGPEVRDSIYRQAATMNSSTGTPISSLRGITAHRGTMAAAGGGSIESGGKGIAGGERLMNQKALEAQLLTMGITGATVAAQIGLRYWSLVRADRKAARESLAAEQGQGPDELESAS